MPAKELTAVVQTKTLAAPNKTTVAPTDSVIANIYPVATVPNPVFIPTAADPPTIPIIQTPIQIGINAAIATTPSTEAATIHVI